MKILSKLRNITCILVLNGNLHCGTKWTHTTCDPQLGMVKWPNPPKKGSIELGLS